MKKMHKQDMAGIFPLDFYFMLYFINPRCAISANVLGRPLLLNAMVFLKGCFSCTIAFIPLLALCIKCIADVGGQYHGRGEHM